MATITSLDTQNVSAYFNTDTQVAVITYRNELTPESTKLAYEWIAESAAAIGIENVRGGIFDFRAVTKFGAYNFTVVRQERQKVKSQHNFSRIPTALVVKNATQEQMVYTAQRITEKSDRFQIVNDILTAMNFIDAWHQKHQ